MERINEGLMFLGTLAERGEEIDDILAKALANYIFREIIEDAHVKYGISQDDMMQMNRTAANRAKLFLEKITGDRHMEMAFASGAIMCNGWDKPKFRRRRR